MAGCVPKLLRYTICLSCLALRSCVYLRPARADSTSRDWNTQPLKRFLICLALIYYKELLKDLPDNTTPFGIVKVSYQGLHILRETWI